VDYKFSQDLKLMRNLLTMVAKGEQVMTKLMSILFVSLFAVTALLAAGESSIKKGEIGYFAGEQLQTPADNGIIGYFADEVWEYPPVTNGETDSAMGDQLYSSVEGSIRCYYKLQCG
jgi:hypothetical protein